MRNHRARMNVYSATMNKDRARMSRLRDGTKAGLYVPPNQYEKARRQTSGAVYIDETLMPDDWYIVSTADDGPPYDGGPTDPHHETCDICGARNEMPRVQRQGSPTGTAPSGSGQNEGAPRDGEGA